MSTLPGTNLGKWSLGLFVITLASFAFMQMMVASGQTGGERFSDNWLLAVPGFSAAISAITAGFLGTISIWRQERAITVIVVTVAGWLILFFVLGEIVSPH